MHIVSRVAHASVKDLRARYDFGSLVHALRGAASQSFGIDPVTRLAGFVGMDESALRRWARVTETIPPKAFEWLLTLRTQRGLPLTWSHFELLVHVKNKKSRRELAYRCAAEDLPVRALASLIRDRATQRAT